MAATTFKPMVSGSFVYENLVSHVQEIQQQMAEINNVLDDRLKNQENIKNELKSHSFTFIDPYGNRIIKQHMDHELTDKVINHYKKNYVPRFLKDWIKIGVMHNNEFSSITDHDPKSLISTYADNYQFIAYGTVTVWIGSYNNYPPTNFVFNVSLMDNMEKLKRQIKEQEDVDNLDLRFCTIKEKGPPKEKNWNEGTKLKPEDSIMSCRLNENSSVIMAKFIRQVLLF